jgi:phage FluMu gp28-like protein
MTIIEHPADNESLLLPYQKKWLRDDSRLKLMEKSRQIGMTWTAAYGVVREASRRNERYDIWIASRDELQGRLFVQDCASWAKILHGAALYWRCEVLVKGGVRVDAVRFASGRDLQVLSSSENAQAGKRGTRVLDEFALHADPRRLYAIASPGITWGGRIEILSTHRGSGNYFNSLVREAREGGNPKQISLHRVTLQDAVEQGFLRKLKAKLPGEDPRAAMTKDEYLQFVRDGCPDEESWLEEYCCVPSDDAASFLPLELIRAAESEAFDAGIEKFPSWDVPIADLKGMKGALYLGVDVGREKDLTVMWLVEVVGERAFTRKLVCLDRMPFSAQEERLYELLSLPRLRRCCIDETGIGRQFAERAAQKFGERRVEGVTLTAALKEELVYPVKAALENRAIKIPPGEGVRADLRSVRRECAAGGGLRFTAEHGKNGHADRFWALALALRAARLGETGSRFYSERFHSREPLVD